MTGDEADGGALTVVPTAREFSADDLALLGDDGGALAPERSAQNVQAELDAIAKHRRENFPAYRRDAQMQARERELLALRETDYPVARAAVAGIFRAIPADERADFEAGFDALPEGAREVVRDFLDVPPGGAVRPATEADVIRFASTPEGAELVAAWRWRAPQKLALLRQRIEVMRMAMSADDADAAMRWLDDLPGPHFKAVAKVLSI